MGAHFIWGKRNSHNLGSKVGVGIIHRCVLYPGNYGKTNIEGMQRRGFRAK